VYAFPDEATDASAIELGTIVVNRGAQVAGHVSDSTGASVVGRVVRLEGSNADRWRMNPAGEAATMRTSWLLDSYVARRQTRTDTLGRFLFPGVPAGNLVIRTLSEDGDEITKRSVTVTESDDMLQLDLAEPVEERVTVTVSDPVGVVLGGVQVSIEYAGNPGAPNRATASATTDSTGCCQVRCAWRGRAVISARPSDQVTLVGGREYARLVANVVLVDRAITVILPFADRVTGSVRLRGSVAPPGGVAYVVARDADGNEIDATRIAVPGRFTLKVPEGSTVDLEAWPDYRMTGTAIVTDTLQVSASEIRRLGSVGSVRAGSRGIELTIE
jgi:hypothetical protein